MFVNTIDQVNVQKVTVNLNELIAALSAAFDLADKMNRDHSCRTTYISRVIAEGLKLSSAEIANIHFASLLHDIVPTGNIFDKRTVFNIINHLPVGEQTADYVTGLWKYKTEAKTDQSNMDNLCQGTRIIFAAEAFEMKCSSHGYGFESRMKLQDWVHQNVASKYENVAAVLLSAMEKEGFWLDMQNDRVKTIVERMAPAGEKYLDINELEEISLAFTGIIDQKSAYTGTHSQRVGRLPMLSHESLAWMNLQRRNSKSPGTYMIWANSLFLKKC